MANISTKPDYFLDYFDAYRASLVEDYFTFLRFQSIGTDPQYANDVRSCCDWLVLYLKSIGLQVSVWETAGQPTVFASDLRAGADKPTVLLYNHYDVQPVDPLELWKYPPFEPALVGDRVYARGAVDNKGQCFYVMHALRALLERDGCLPVNLKLCIEGEEEFGSPSLPAVVAERKAELAADYLYIVDAGIRAAGIPAVTLGCRGITCMTVNLQGSSTDLHSGENGGIVYNPLHALVAMLGKLRDESGRITIPGFYDDVLALSPEEKNQLSFEFDAGAYRTSFGAEANGGENDYSPLESAWVRPTLEINGISGGYAGEGFKTVIPARASAKVSCRLVPRQTPEKITELVTSYLEKIAPPGIKVSVATEGGGAPLRTGISSRATQAAAAAYTEVCGKPCEYILTGGSIPISAKLAEVSGAETVYLGYGLPDDNIHAPNEFFDLTRMKLGLATVGRILEILGT